MPPRGARRCFPQSGQRADTGQSTLESNQRHCRWSEARALGRSASSIFTRRLSRASAPLRGGCRRVAVPVVLVMRRAAGRGATMKATVRMAMTARAAHDARPQGSCTPTNKAPSATGCCREHLTWFVMVCGAVGSDRAEREHTVHDETGRQTTGPRTTTAVCPSHSRQSIPSAYRLFRKSLL